MSAPQTYAEVVERLRDAPAATPGRRAIARLVLDDPEGLAFRTIGEAAALAGVHPSSLVRFARHLGLPGYPALVSLCRAQLSDDAQLVRRFDQAAGRAPDEALARAAEDDVRAVRRTAALVDPDAWAAAVELLSGAPAVHVVGLRKCGAVAELAAYLLHLARPRVRRLGVAASLADELRDVAAGDVLVAIGIHRYSRDTVRAFEQAAARGARTVAVTDTPASPLAGADVVLRAETAGSGLLRSVSGLVFVVQALATAVAVARGVGAREELADDEELLAAFGTFVD